MLEVVSAGKKQETVWQTVGTKIMDNCLTGYNACLFAYGQTGSGKSYSMMGSDADPGESMGSDTDPGETAIDTRTAPHSPSSGRTI